MVFDVVYDLGVASTWTWSAKVRPVKVRLTKWQSRVGPGCFQGGGGGGLKKRKHKKAKKLDYGYSGICRGTVGDPIVPLKRDLARAERRETGESAVPGTALGGGWLGLKHSR